MSVADTATRVAVATAPGLLLHAILLIATVPTPITSALDFLALAHAADHLATRRTP